MNYPGLDSHTLPDGCELNLEQMYYRFRGGSNGYEKFNNPEMSIDGVIDKATRRTSAIRQLNP